jgi:hypothetical protein
MIDKADQWPGGNIIVRGSNHIYIVSVGFSGIPRIGGFGIDWLHNIIRSIQGLIPDQLDLHCAVPEFLHNENSHILLLATVKGCTQDNGVYIPIHIISNRNIIDKVVPIQIQVVDHVLTVIQASLKSFQGFRLLEQVHHGIEVKIVTRKTEIFTGIILSRHKHRCRCKDC